MVNAFKRLRYLLVFAGLSAIIVAASTSVYAQELLIKQDDYKTELFLKIAPKELLSVDAIDKNSVEIKFRKSMKTPFSKKIDDNFVRSVEGKQNTVLVKFNPLADFAVFNDPEGLKIIATNASIADKILLSYGINAPMLKKTEGYVEQPELEPMLKEADSLAARRMYQEAITKLNTLLGSTHNGYYVQEALYKLGNVYMAAAESDPNLYAEAADTMDKLIMEFPDGSRVPQARKVGAKAKEKSGQLSGAISMYQTIYNTSADSETKRDALGQIGELYAEMGQLDSAITAFEQYLNNFKAGTEKVKTKLGNLYLSRGVRDKSYKLFKDVPVDVITKTVDRPQLLTLAKVFEENGETRKAKELYEFLLKKDDILSPYAISDTPESPEAAYRYAQLLKEEGDLDKYSKTLEDLFNYTKESIFGLTAMVEYAEMNIQDKTASEWYNFLAPVYANQEAFNLIQRSQRLLIKAYENEGDAMNMLSMLDIYIAEYPMAKDVNELLKLKEDTLFKEANRLKVEKNYEPALNMYADLVSTFPDSPQSKLAVQYIDDIKYDQVYSLFENKDYSDVISAIELKIFEEPNSGKRWFDLWEDSLYQNIVSNVGVLPDNIIRYKAREYLTMLPKGKYVEDVKTFLAEAFRYPYFRAYQEAKDAEVLSLYDENKSWLDSWPDQELNNKAKVAVAGALLRIGMKDKASEIFTNITPMMDRDYAMLGYSLCENFIYDVNNLSVEEFEKAVDEAEMCGAAYAADVASKYTNDLKVSAKTQYNISKNVSNNKLREEILNNVYNMIMQGKEAHFEGYEEVYLDVGMQAYSRNDFAGALIPLGKYVDLAKGNSEKKAEALYYLGKSLIMMGDIDNGYRYYDQIVKSMPDSVYKNMAKSELEDAKWRKSMENR